MVRHKEHCTKTPRKPEVKASKDTYTSSPLCVCISSSLHNLSAPWAEQDEGWSNEVSSTYLNEGWRRSSRLIVSHIFFQSKFHLLQPSDQLLSPQTWQLFILNLPIHNSNSLFWILNSKTVFNLLSSLNVKSGEHWISHGTVSSLSLSLTSLHQPSFQILLNF